MPPLTFLVLGVLGGLGLFILGMKTMSEGLLKLTGAPLRHRLEKLAGNRVAGVLFGSILASALQSSGAAAIIVVGFVNAGLLSLYQSLAILLGTSVGTTIAVQFIAFKFYFFSPAAIFAGMMLKLFGKQRRIVYCGEVLLGIGLLFLGLEIMESNFDPLQKTAIFQAFHSLLFTWKINAVLLGAFLTLALQSGSATIAVVMTLAATGIFGVETGAAMVLGECIGTSVMATVGTIGGSLAARRAALMYLLTCASVVVAVLILFTPFMAAVAMISPAINEMTTVKAVIPRTIANAHTCFSLLLVLIGLPLTGILSRAGVRMVRGKSESMDIEPRTRYLDDKILNTPSIAYLQARNELKRMTKIVSGMYANVVSLFNDYNAQTVEDVKHMEDVLDILQRDISGFLVKLLQQPGTPLMFNEIPGMLRTVENLEHIGDLCEMIADCLRRKKEDRIYFTEGAMTEIIDLASIVTILISRVSDCMNEQEISDADMHPLLEQIVDKRSEHRRNHIDRLAKGQCSVAAGLVYNDISGGFEKIAENCMMIIESENKNAESSR